MLSKTVNLRPLKSSSVIRVRTPERAARIHERNAVDEPTHEYKPILKTSYDSGIYKLQKAKLSKIADPNENKMPQILSVDRTSDAKHTYSTPLHVAEYFIHKKKKFNEQLDHLSNVPQSKVVSQDDYKVLRNTSQGFIEEKAPERGEEADKRNVYRKNFYISKPFEDINKDFKYQPLVRKAQTGSEDTPYWFQGTAKFYTQDNIENAKQMRSAVKNIPKGDIFGNPNMTYQKQEDPFKVQPPSKGQRYEMNKMVLLEKKVENDNKYQPSAKLSWKEDMQKQSYDKARITLRVDDAEPYIKRIREKASMDPELIYKKVGENANANRLKKEKGYDLKIGHANDFYTYTKKAREDGFLANRKEITGENFQRSDFFVC